MASSTTSSPFSSGLISGNISAVVGGAFLAQHWEGALAEAIAAEEKYLTKDYQKLNPGDDVVVEYREGDFDYMASQDVIAAEYGGVGIAPTGALRKHAKRNETASAKRISDRWNKVNPFA